MENHCCVVCLYFVCIFQYLAKLVSNDLLIASPSTFCIPKNLLRGSKPGATLRFHRRGTKFCETGHQDPWEPGLPHMGRCAQATPMPNITPFISIIYFMKCDIILGRLFLMFYIKKIYICFAIFTERSSHVSPVFHGF